MAEHPIPEQELLNRVYKGPKKTGDNVDGLVLLPYTWDGAAWQRAGVNASIERYDVEGNVVYVGQAPKGTATSAAAWTITKYDLSDMTAASGLISSTTAIWDNRASTAYS